METWTKTLAFLMLVVVTMPCRECRQPVLHRVGGGRHTWRPDVNFTDWASHEIFFVGDWLYFGFNKCQFNVLQVNQTSYENCIDTNLIKNITRGGRDVFNLSKPETYYFISQRIYCLKGMKLRVYVPPSPIFPPKNGTLPLDSFPNGSALLTGSIQTQVVLLLASALVRIFIFPL
ncbi:hypothetical protein SLE2022_197160 [Rubroshorea leprosula]